MSGGVSGQYRQESATSARKMPAPPTTAGQPTVLQCIDAYVAGNWDLDVLLHELRADLRVSPDNAWEILSVADQYFRRGKISSGAHGRIKSCVGAGHGVADSMSATDLPQAKPPIAAPDPHPPSTPSSPDVLRDRYRLTGIVSHGESATIFAALDTYLVGLDPTGQRLAIKVLAAQMSRQPDKVQTFLTAFERLRSLSHPNIVRVYDVDRHGDQVFLTMELLVGMTLSEAFKKDPDRFSNFEYAQQLIQSVGSGIAHAHGRGVVHGNIHPDNVFIVDGGGVRVLGFGSLLPESEATGGYASREVLAGQTADERDDLFALAGVAYHLLSGRHPCSVRSARNAPAGLAQSQWTALIAGLELDRSQRPSDVATWLRELFDERPMRDMPSAPERVAAAPSFPWAMRLGILVAMLLLPAVSLWHSDVPQNTLINSAPIVDQPVVISTPVVATTPVVVHQPPPVTEPAVARPATAWATNVRIEFQASDVELSADDAYARVVVRRRGNIRGKVSFIWWTEAGTAKPGRDFESVSRRTELIEDGKATTSLLIPVIAGAGRATPVSFYLFIDEPSPGALLGSKFVAIVTIPASTQP
jgi:serine/threonine protein kinase